jgi:hypothetical protein
MFRSFRTRLMLTAVLCAAQFSATAAHAAQAFSAPAKELNGYYPKLGHKLRFVAQRTGAIGFSKNQLDTKARELMRDATRNNTTYVWDDNWYKMTLTSDETKYLIAVAYDETANAYRWIAVKGGRSRWYIRTSEQRDTDSAFDLHNGSMTKVSMWVKGQERVDIDVKNPENGRDSGVSTTSNDIFFGFGK